jgi:hypothetical protein
LFKEIVRLHGFPASITWGREISSLPIFKTTSWNKLSTILQFSYTYHPQIDGKNEIINISLGNLLRCLVGERQGQWYIVLTQYEFAYQNSINRYIGKFPFHIANGRSPTCLTYLVLLEGIQKSIMFNLSWITRNNFMNMCKKNYKQATDSTCFELIAKNNQKFWRGKSGFNTFEKGNISQGHS